MRAVLAPLDAALADGATADAIAAFAEHELPGAATDLDALDDAARRWANIETLAAAAWTRYPTAVQSGGAHRMDPDPRAMTLFATTTYIQRAGFYTPDDLAAMRDEQRAPTDWVAREAFRLSAFLIALQALITALDDATLPVEHYADAVLDLAQRFARIPLHTTTDQSREG